METTEKTAGKRARWAPDGETVTFLRHHMEARGWGVVDMARFFECDRRVITDWLAGRPMPAAQRAAVRKALEAPAAVEAVEAIARVASLLRPAQAATIDHGAGVARKAAPSGGARREPPAPAPPSTPSPAALAAALARRKKPDV